MEALNETVKAAFRDIGPQINGSLLYCDSGCAQLIRMNVGLSHLFSIGATNVCDLAEPSSQDGFFAIMQGRPLDTLCIFISQLLTDSHKYIVRAVLAHPSVNTLHVFSALSEHAHACQASTILGVEAYSEYASLLRHSVDEAADPAGRQQGGGADLKVTVEHFPLSMCALDSCSFVLPSTSAAAMLARSGGAAAGYMGSDRLREDDDGEEGVQRGVSLLAHTLASIAAQLHAKPHPFCLGPVSQQLAVELSDLPLPPTPSSRDASPLTPMAVILVDRSLDLLTPCRHADHLVDTWLALLPRAATPSPPRPPHQDDEDIVSWRGLDVRVDVGAAYPLAEALEGGGQLGSGLHHPDDPRAVQWLEDLLGRKGKDAALYLRKWLKEALRNEKLPPPVRSKAGMAPPSEFAALAGALAATPGTALRNRVILTLGFANAAALGGEGAQRWEAAAALERQVLMTAPEDPDSAGAALLDALDTIRQGKGLLRVEDVVAVLLQVHSLVGDGAGGPPFTPTMEGEIAQALTSAISQGEGGARSCLSKSVQQRLEEAGSGSEESRRVAGEQVGALMAALSRAASARQGLQEFRHWTSSSGYGLQDQQVIQRSTSTAGGAPSPLLRRLVDRILQEDPLSELQPPTSVVGGLLSKGLGRLGLQGLRGPKAKPADFPLVMVFVVGGVSPIEIREVRQEVSEQEFRKKPRVLVGGTCLVSPEDVVARAFGG